jgi:hypothetical protein
MDLDNVSIPILDLFDNRTKNEFIKIKHEIKEKRIFYQKAYDLAFDMNIKKGETIYCLLTGDFIFGDFIPAFIQENNLQVKELTVISLSGGKENYETFEALIDENWVKKINLCLSGYYLRTKKTKHSPTINQLSEISKKYKDKFKIYYTNTHQKITLIETEQGGKVTMHGSANLKSSQSLEQLMIQENADLYDFNYQYFQNLINK